MLCDVGCFDVSHGLNPKPLSSTLAACRMAECGIDGSGDVDQTAILASNVNKYFPLEIA